MILSLSDFVGAFRLTNATPSQIAEGERYFLGEVFKDPNYIDLIYTELSSPTPTYFAQVIRDGRTDALPIKSWLVPSVYSFISNSTFQTSLPAGMLSAKTKSAERTLLPAMFIVGYTNITYGRWSKFYYNRANMRYLIEFDSLSGSNGIYEVKSVSTANEFDFNFLEPTRKILYNGQEHDILSVVSTSPYKIEVKDLTETGELLVEFRFLDFLRNDLDYILSVL